MDEIGLKSDHFPEKVTAQKHITQNPKRIELTCSQSKHNCRISHALDESNVRAVDVKQLKDLSDVLGDAEVALSMGGG